MQSMRKNYMRWMLVSFLLPGYLLLLSANRETDGSFDLWLDLTLDTSLGKSISTSPESSQNALLIGEWKQFRQVNTSTVPTEMPEVRDAKHTQRPAHIPIYDTIAADLDTIAVHHAYLGSHNDSAVSFDDYQTEPMESGLSIGAP
jgi:hypothetical protein